MVALLEGEGRDGTDQRSRVVDLALAKRCAIHGSHGERHVLKAHCALLGRDDDLGWLGCDLLLRNGLVGGRLGMCCGCTHEHRDGRGAGCAR